MAKKRVHEIAKERGIPSKEVLSVLQSAGVEVKAAASSVDEEDIRRAFEGGNGDGASAPAAAADAPAPPPPRERAPRTSPDGGGAAAPEAPASPAEQPAREAPPQRPTRPTRPSESGPPGGAGRRRRVVIDSQASRRTAPPPMQHQPPRRRGRRRKTPWVEPDLNAPAPEVKEEPPTKINSGATVKEVAESLGLSTPEVIKKLMTLGEMATLTQTLSDEAVGVLADEFDKKVEMVHAADEVEEEPDFEDPEDALAPRPPVVAVMGHVDHGKTSLLDVIRQTDVASGEAGGITQHIGAYQVHRGEEIVTFLDTPGHQAFTAMRARGAQVTDVAVIVVAADDGVMPQTVEAIDHAKAAEVPMIVAVNKIDKEGADPNRVRGELAQQGLTPADWGGDVEFRDVSAVTKEGVDGLLDDIVTVAEIEELRANPNADASGAVIESRLDPGRGPVVSILVQRGTLKVGDALVAGAHWGRVRAMHDYRGERVTEARPGEPVEVLGFDGVPEAGENVRAVENERQARQLAAERSTRLKTESLARRQSVRISLEDIFERARKGETTALNLIVKADVAGSLEALEDEIAKLPHEQVAATVIHDGVGGINESDVMLAAASDAVIVGFNVRPVQDAAQVAAREGVEIRTYSVIYRVIEELRAALEGLLEPEEVEQTVATAEVRETFRASRVGMIAGCYVTSGTVRRGAQVRLVRDGTVVYDGRIGSLRRFKDDVREVQEGFECGIVLENFADIKQEDVLETYETRQVDRQL
jgi:translation initiation factor IF-2